MATRNIDLQALLDPVGLSRFFELYWEKQPLHLRRAAADFYAELMSVADLESLIASPQARYPAIQLSKGGAYFPPEIYCDDVKFGAETFTAVPNLQRLTTEYNAGATVVLPALHRTWTPLKNTCAAIEKELDHAVHANAYLTPGGTQGFSPHYDTHEVFVLQLGGRKHWRIYAPPIELPHRKQPFNPLGYVIPDTPVSECDLEAGDLLYLPRGYVHTTTTDDGYSAHITIGIAVYTWLDLAGEALHSAMDSLSFRKSLPPGFAHRSDELPALRVALATLLRRFGEQRNETQLVDMFLARVRPSLSVQFKPFRADVFVVSEKTKLTAPAPEDYRVVAQGSKIAIEYQLRRFILPAEAREVLEFIRQHRHFCVADLPTAMQMATKQALIRSLHEKGFLTVSATFPGVE